VTVVTLTFDHKKRFAAGVKFYIQFKNHIMFFLSKTGNVNKRAQRALGRSPEEKVKGHSGANNREP